MNIDIHSQAEYDARKDEPGACLHIVAGHIAEVSGRVEVVADSGSVGRVADSGSVGVVTGSGRVGRVADSGSVGVVAGSGSVGVVAGSGSVGRVAGSGSVEVVAGSGSVEVVAGSGSVEVVAGSGRVGVVADSGSVGVVTGSGSVGRVADSGRVGVVADSGRVEVVTDSGSVEAAGTATIHAHGGTVKAGAYVTVYQHSPTAKITGGRVVPYAEFASMTPQDWADSAGLPVEDGCIILFKAVGADLVSDHGTKYEPGTTVTAPDWGPVRECGSGLHFSPHPNLAAIYVAAATKRYLACRVALADIAVLDNTKIKARSCVVLHEVDADRKPLTVETVK